MPDGDLSPLAQRFEGHRQRVRGVALRMLGSSNEADDAVQETWLRLGRADAGALDNLGGWLTTVVARICLDMLRARARRPAVAAAAAEAEAEVPDLAATSSPEDEAVLADAVGRALVVVSGALSPPERLAFVLHDLFGVGFEEIAPIVGRTVPATRQLASRGRRRVQGAPAYPQGPATAQRELVAAFLAASRRGEFGALLQLLDPEVVLRADPAALSMAAGRVATGAPELAAEVRGADAVARVFAGRAKVAALALVDGLAGAVVSVGGRPRVVFGFTVADGRVVGIELLADPGTLDVVHLEHLERP